MCCLTIISPGFETFVKVFFKAFLFCSHNIQTPSGQVEHLKCTLISLRHATTQDPCVSFFSKGGMITESKWSSPGFILITNVTFRMKIANDCKRSEDGEVIKLGRLNICRILVVFATLLFIILDRQ